MNEWINDLLVPSKAWTHARKSKFLNNICMPVVYIYHLNKTFIIIRVVFKVTLQERLFLLFWQTLAFLEIDKLGSNQMKSYRIESNLIESNRIEPNRTEPNQTKPNQTKSNQIKSNQIKSNQIKSNQNISKRNETTLS